MKLGFTGTQQGMSDWQKRRLRAFLKHFRPTEFHHGDCVGADATAHKLVREVLPDCRIVVHPGDHPNPRKRAFCQGDEIRDPLPMLLRNDHIVAETDELIATPKEDEEQLRSGTWATIRRARKALHRVEVIEREEPRTT